METLCLPQPVGTVLLNECHLRPLSTNTALTSKGCLSLFNYFIDMSPTHMSPFFVEKTSFRRKKQVFSTKNGLIWVGLISIK